MADIVFDDGGVLVPFVIDVTEEERHRLSAQVTEHPVERGAAISDHMRRDRDVLTLQVVISQTPLFSPDEDLATRIRDAWDQLLDAQARALLGVVTTNVRTYEDMVLLEAVATKRAADGTWIRAELTFAEVILVATELVDDPTPARPRDRRQTNLGDQATEPADERLRSFARRGLDAFLELL